MFWGGEGLPRVRRRRRRASRTAFHSAGAAAGEHRGRRVAAWPPTRITHRIACVTQATAVAHAAVSVSHPAEHRDRERQGDGHCIAPHSAQLVHPIQYLGRGVERSSKTGQHRVLLAFQFGLEPRRYHLVHVIKNDLRL